MKEFNYVVTDAAGIHARPAGELVKAAAQGASKVTISKEGKEVDAKRIMGVMSLGVKCGQEVTIKVEGEDEDALAATLEAFMKENL